MRPEEIAMSLRGFHILFIIASIGLCAFFSWWAYEQYQENHSASYLATAVISSLISLGLILYTVQFIKKTKNLLAFHALALLLIPRVGEACSVCFAGDPTQKASVALRNSVIFLLAVLLGVLALFAKFFISVAKRSKLTSFNE